MTFDPDKSPHGLRLRRGGDGFGWENVRMPVSGSATGGCGDDGGLGLCEEDVE